MVKIEVLQPPRNNLQSGGYLFNSNISKFLKKKRMGKLVELKTEDLIKYIVASSSKRTVFALDSIYLQSIDYSQIKPFLKEKKLQIIILLHLLPSEDLVGDSFDYEKIQKLKSRELAWIKQSNFLVIVTGRSYKQELLRKGILPSRVKVIYPGQNNFLIKENKVIEPKKIEYPVKGITVGSLSPRKNQILLVEMLTKINPELYKWTFIGNNKLFPEYTKRIMNLANQGKWRDSLFFAGQAHHSKVLKSLSNSDLFVSTSVKESYGISVAEACSAGLPVLSLNTGDFSRWVKPNHNGYLIDPEDLQEIMSKLNDVIKNLSLLTHLKIAAKKHSSGIHFSTWEESYLKFEKVCRTIYSK